MKLLGPLTLLILVATIMNCSVLPPRRQYIREVKKQKIPKEILNTNWTLESFDHKTPDCSVTMSFLEKGQFIIKFKSELYQGDYLWYIVRDTGIEFHTRPLEKLAWTKDNCETNPSSFALYVHGDKKVSITNDRLTFVTFDNRNWYSKKCKRPITGGGFME